MRHVVHHRPVSRTVAVATSLALVLGFALPGPAQTAANSFVLGGIAAMPSWAVDDVTDRTGIAPTRLAGTDRFATAAAISRHAHPDGADTVYVASGRDFPDALAAAQAVAANDAALVLVDTAHLPSVATEELARLAPREVFALGGPTAVSDTVLDRVGTATGIRPVRLSGSDRVGTAVAIARHTFPDGGTDTVYLASGASYADALAAAPAVAADGAALLLTAPDALPVAVADEVERLAPERMFVLGGAAAVSDAVLDDAAAVTGQRPLRLAGPDRFATAETLAAHAHPEGAAIRYAANGFRFPDALAAVPALAADDAGLLLVDTRLHWSPQLDAAKAYAAGRAGTVSFSLVDTDGRRVGWGSDTAVPMASVLKVIFMTAYLRQPEVRDRPLTTADRALLEPMITRSENDPATRIADALGPGPFYELATDAGMQEFSYTRPWGLSTTSARDQSRFLYELERFLPPRHSGYALQLLTRIVPEQRWGIGEVALPEWTVHFKGGWGSGTGATDHQVVRLEHPAGARIALAVMTIDSPSHEYGKDTLHGVFSRLLADLP